jgi:hypothetical protein
VHAVGLRAGANVFVTTANAGQAGRLLGALKRLEVDEMSWEPAAFDPTGRGRRNERLRPSWRTGSGWSIRHARDAGLADATSPSPLGPRRLARRICDSSEARDPGPHCS